jgi:uncharacterized protein
MKFSKKLIRFMLPLSIIILSIIVPFSCAKGEVKFPAPTNLKYINDYADVLDMDTKEYLVSVGSELENKTGAQAVIVIINSLEGNDESSYGNELFRAWGIGQKEKNNGLLVLLSMEEKRWRVEVGRGLEGAIPDILSNRVMEDAAVPEFKNGNYGEGLRKAYSIFADLIAKEYGVTLEKNEKIEYDYNVQKGKGTPILIFFIIGLFLIDMILNRGRVFRFLLDIIFWNSFFGGGRGGRGGRGGHGGFGGGGFGGSGSFGGFGGGDSGGGGSSGGW